MTAITPAYAHAYQLICLTRHIPFVPSQKFRLPAAKARYPHLSNIRTTTREKGNEFMTAITSTYAHAYQSICLAGRPQCFPIKNVAYLLPKPDIRIFPTLGPQRTKTAMISMVV